MNPNTKKAVIIGAVVVLIIAVVTILILMKKKKDREAAAKELTEKELMSGNTTGGLYSYEDLKAKGYDDDEIATIMDSESYKNGTLQV